MMAKKIADGKTENKTYRRCSRIECSYYTQSGCKACDSCKSPPYVLKKSCDTCHRCENEPGFIRWKDDKQKIDSLIPEGMNEEEFFLKLLRDAIDKRLTHMEQEKQKEEQPPEIIIER